jgi:hypothetical protein
MKGLQAIAVGLVTTLTPGLVAAGTSPPLGAAGPPVLQSVSGAGIRTDSWFAVKWQIWAGEYHVTRLQGACPLDLPAARKDPDCAHNLGADFALERPVVAPRVWSESAQPRRGQLDEPPRPGRRARDVEPVESPQLARSPGSRMDSESGSTRGSTVSALINPGLEGPLVDAD